MLHRLSRLLKSEPHTTPDEDKRLAAAVLLYEVAHADFEHHPLELEEVRRGLHEEFGLADEVLDALLADARQRQQHAVSLHEFAQTLNRTMGAEEKAALMRLLWRVAWADGRLDAHEEHRLRHIAALLHVPHSVFIRSKLDEAPGA
jgi:uncharacterized tellurite resistance protein B-like protein